MLNIPGVGGVLPGPSDEYDSQGLVDPYRPTRTNVFGDLIPSRPPVATPTPSPAPATGAPSAPSALSAWNTFYNSPAYQVPLAEGLEGVNTAYAAKGALESGAAMKAINNYAAGHAASALSTYLDNLYRQEALGAQAASSLAGVGTNMVSQVSSNNTAAGNAAGNAILYGGQASANNWNNIGGAIGTAAGTIGGALSSSYQQPAYDYDTLQNSGIYGDAWDF